MSYSKLNEIERRIKERILQQSGYADTEVVARKLVSVFKSFDPQHTGTVGK